MQDVKKFMPGNNQPAINDDLVAMYPVGFLKAVTFFYLIFVVYGNLVPFGFQGIPLQDAIDKFSQVPFKILGIDRRADWVANGLLFIPLTFLLQSLFAFSPRRFRYLVSLLIFGFGIFLAVFIEFTQIFFPVRTVSQNDIIAEILGSALGIVAWYRWGDRFRIFLHDWQSTQDIKKFAQLLLSAYAVLLLGYNVLPLDLVVSTDEIAAKWEQSKINLMPFVFYRTQWTGLLYDIGATFAIWYGFALLLQASGRVQGRHLVLYTLYFATALEAVQFFIYTRFSDINDILLASLAGLLTLITGPWLARKFASLMQPSKRSGHIPTSLLLLVFLVINALIFWYPYQFNWSLELFSQRLQAALSATPLEVYYAGNEYRAITQFFRKIIFFIPFGLVLAWSHFHYRRLLDQKMASYLYAIILLVPSLVIEAGQLFISGKSVQIADLVLQWSGGLIGLFGLLHLFNRYSPVKPPVAENEMFHLQPIDIPFQTRAYLLSASLWPVVLFVVLFGITLNLVLGLDGIPYNLKELFRDNNLFYALMFGMFVSGFGLAVAWIAENLQAGPGRFLKHTLIVLVGSFALFVLLYQVVTGESLADILGSPVAVLRLEEGQYLRALGPELLIVFGGEGLRDLVSPVELAIRFAALVAPVLVFSAVFIQAMGNGIGRFVKQSTAYLLGFVPLLLASRLITIDFTPTDNLTELIADNGGYYLYTLIMLFGFSVAWFTRLSNLSPVNIIKQLAGVGFAVWLGWLLLNAGMEHTIVKYGRVFSGIDFILGPDRDTLLSQSTLFLRWSALYLAALTVFVLPARRYRLYLYKRRQFMNNHADAATSKSHDSIS